MPFRDIAGHRHLFELVAGAATRGTLPPSLIFAGPDGVGKRMAALALAQFVNCLQPTAEDACGTCASCTRIARLMHSDVLLIEPGDTGAIKVDQVRDAIERTGYRPFEGRRRVVVIDDADAMLGEAQNALLKTLEEPPASSMFVLVTSRPDMLLPTVRSRCQQLRFGRLAAEEIADVLAAAHGYSPAEARAAASVADGSVGQALEGGADEFVEAREAAADMLQRVAGSADPRRRLDGAKALAGAGDRDELRRRLRALASMLRDLSVLGVAADEHYLANADVAADLRRLSASFDPERITTAFAAVDRALEAVDRNASPKIVADWLAFQL
ncbi:MAG TPA: DNA polymerase III subunit delta' [Vicinamibacterales bacterium]|nr:DNA polymerase III subunit delta' [Vicinamibacterales bacterium]